MYKPKTVRVKAVIEVPAGDLCQDARDTFKCPFLTPLWRCTAFDFVKCEVKFVGNFSYDVKKHEKCLENEAPN